MENKVINFFKNKGFETLIVNSKIAYSNTDRYVRVYVRILNNNPNAKADVEYDTMSEELTNDTYYGIKSNDVGMSSFAYEDRD